MGYWLHQRWKEDTAIDEGVTDRYELPSKGILSSIHIHAKDERSTTVRDAVTLPKLLEDELTKLEIIANGSKVIKSLTCNEAMFSNLLDFKRPPYRQYTEDAGAINFLNVCLNLGRYPRDPAYGLDCSKYDLLELKITNAATVETKTGWTDAKLDYEIWLDKYVGSLPGRVGYFKTSEKKSYTSSGGSAWDEVPLPCLNPYRRILLRSFLTTKTPGEGISEVVFEINEGEYTPFFGVPLKMCTDDIKNRGLNSYVNGEIQNYASASAALTESKLAYPQSCVFGVILEYGAQTWQFQKYDAGRLKYNNGAATLGETQFRLDGAGYEYSASIPFDLPDLEESYFSTADLSKVKLKWKETAQKPVISVVLDELVKE